MGKVDQDQKIIAGLAVGTALIHFVLAVLSRSDTTFLLLFLLNGVGYLVLLSAYFGRIKQLKGYEQFIRIAFIGFTAVTFVAYFVANWPNIWGPVGIIDKAIELALLVMLIRR